MQLWRRAEQVAVSTGQLTHNSSNNNNNNNNNSNNNNNNNNKVFISDANISQVHNIAVHIKVDIT